MEDGLVHFIAIDSIDEDTIVLILVVMEDGLVQAWMQGIAKHFNDSLNPCCDGRWSRTCLVISIFSLNSCLNPCCDGRWSRTNTRYVRD